MSCLKSLFACAADSGDGGPKRGFASKYAKLPKCCTRYVAAARLRANCPSGKRQRLPLSTANRVDVSVPRTRQEVCHESCSADYRKRPARDPNVACLVYRSGAHREASGIPDAERELLEISFLEVDLAAIEDIPAGQPVPVQINAVITEVGTLELWMKHTKSDRRWKVEFLVRTE
jgi:hypothetical protein